MRKYTELHFTCPARCMLIYILAFNFAK
jgi:hypothetical protein